MLTRVVDSRVRRPPRCIAGPWLMTSLIMADDVTWQCCSARVVTSGRVVSGDGQDAWRASRLCRARSAFSPRRWRSRSSRRRSSSAGIGSPLHVRRRDPWPGRPGPRRVFSRFRHLARRFWNQTWNQHHNNYHPIQHPKFATCTHLAESDARAVAGGKWKRRDKKLIGCSKIKCFKITFERTDWWWVCGYSGI